MYITKEEILEKITQESIMERYFPYNINYNKTYCNPFRTDKSPGCTFKYDKDKRLLFIDWSKRKSYDCFEVCKHVLSSDMHNILKRISRDFNLSTNSFKDINKVRKTKVYKKKQQVNVNSFSLKTEIFDKWTTKSLVYWWQFGIEEEDLLRFNVIPCYKAYLGDYRVWTYSERNPMYRYKTEKGIQIYRPKASKIQGRFTQNLPPNHVLGLEQLPEKGEVLFITSSYKDVMVLYKLGLPAICPIGESGIIDENILNDLKLRFSKIIINFNNDEAGIEGTERLLKLHPSFEFFYTEDEKDPADYVREYGYVKLKELISNKFKDIWI